MLLAPRNGSAWDCAWDCAWGGRAALRTGVGAATHDPAVPGHHACMSAVRAELSSISSTLSELTRRVTALAEQARDEQDADLAAELFSVERGLNGALRRLQRATTGDRGA